MTVRIPLDDIVYDPRYMPREGIDVDDTVLRYTEILVADPKFDFPPVVVAKRPPGNGPTNVILDGAHRYVSYQRAKRDTIPVVIETIPQSQWFARAVELNAAHGRPLTLVDRTKISGRLVRDGWTVDRIANLLKVRVETISPLIGSKEDMRPVTARRQQGRRQGTRPSSLRLPRNQSPKPNGKAAETIPTMPTISVPCRVLDGAIRVIESGEALPADPQTKERLVKLRDLLAALLG